MFANTQYNPDVLTCLANLSSDEVFTPPKLANEMLDTLPSNLWSNPEAKFLDPCCKSGIFLREIAKRLLSGLEEKIPDRQKRINHIFKNQLYGIAITELTALISRRSLYCSKIANSKFSVCDDFVEVAGNIRYVRTEHAWKNGKCMYCGASKENYKRDESLESHAYEFIHTEKPEEIFNMKFDVIIGNPPYQLSTKGSSAQAIPIYHKFIQSSKRLNPTYIVMITPSRWFSGGMGLNDFRKEMMGDTRIKQLVDFPNSKDCFNSVSISGGVSYFLWDRNYSGKCSFTNVRNKNNSTTLRKLDEYKFLIRDNYAVSIIDKIQKLNNKSITEIVYPIDPFKLKTSFRGNTNASTKSLRVTHSKGVGFMKREDLVSGLDLVEKYKVILSQTTSEHAGEPSKSGKYKLFSTIKVLSPKEVSTFSYLVIGSFKSKLEANNLKKYLMCKFSRFLVLQAISSIHITQDKFLYLPLEDFSREHTDESLYKKYNLNKEEITYIENTMTIME